MMNQLLKSEKVFYGIVLILVIILVPFSGVLAQNDKKSPPEPVTTKNPDISI